jgi:alpha-D-ribose 1-methylphosphonate 5-triphosphate synthase subunit PhnH
MKMNKLTENELVKHSSEIWLPAMQQQVFRKLVDGFSYPGRITACAVNETSAWLAILASLLDGETSLADPHQLLAAELWPKLEARSVIAEKAAFILADGSLAPDLHPCIGTLETPETAATLLLRVTSLRSDLTGNVRLNLTGPGIKPPLSISVDGLHPGWLASRHAWVAAFPLGVDMVLCDSHRFVALPRTTQINTGDNA